MLDTTYWGRYFGVVVIKDYLSGQVLWHKFIYSKETIVDYQEGLHFLLSKGCDIQCIVADGLKGIKNSFPEIPFQLCQYHQIQTVRIKLTNKPKLEASKALLALVKVLTKEDKETFIIALDDWYEQWKDFLNERSENKQGKTFYTHKKLRSAYFGLKRNLDILWTFQEFKDIKVPNTNNAIESLFSHLKSRLRLHRGISLNRRKMIIKEFLNTHKPRR